jgi:tRNA(Ile)-lysidine synthase
MEYNPNIIRTLARSTGVMRDEDGFMDAHAASLLPGLISSDLGWIVRLDGPAWAGLHVAIRRRMLRLVAGRLKGDMRGIGAGHVEDALDMLDAGHTGRGVDMPGGVRVESSYGDPVIYRPDGMPGAFEAALGVPGRIVIPEAGIEVEVTVAGQGESPPGGDGDMALFDLDKLAGPLAVRSRRPGDRFQPSGMAGSVKLKEYLIDMKVSRVDRALTPILTSGGEIAWVMGHRQDRRFMPGPDSGKLAAVRIMRNKPAG